MQRAVGLQQRAVFINAPPCLIDAAAFQRRDQQHRRRPRCQPRSQQVQRMPQVRGRVGRGIAQLAVRFVDHHDVRQLHDAALDALQVIAAGRRQQQEKNVGHRRDLRLRLADADRLDDNAIVVRRFAQQHRLPRAPRHTALRFAGRRRADERARVGRQFFHARFVAENRAAAAPSLARRTRVDRQHRHALALRQRLAAERFDEGGFADARRAADADAQRAAGVRHGAAQEFFGRAAVRIPRRFHQRDGARQCPAVA